MSYGQITQKVFEDIFKKFHKTALVTLRSSKTKNENYDPYRNTGYDETYQNVLPVKYIGKTISPSSLTYNQIGLVEAGALKIIVSDDDAELIKNSEKLEIDLKTYYAYSEAVGNRFQLYPTQYSGYSMIIVFQKDVNL